MSSSLLRPVGPQPPAVYWFRRALLLAAVTALVLLTVLLTGRGGQAEDGGPGEGAARAQPTGEPTQRPEPRPAAAAGPGQSASASQTAAADAAPADCGEALVVAVAADATGYAAEAVPVLSVSLRNGGTRPCTVDVGSADAVELVVSSGDDRIWSSDDCQQAAETRVVTLDPGAEEVQSVTWQRGRSAEGCPAGLPETRPGTYQVTARAGGVTSEPVAFTLG